MLLACRIPAIEQGYDAALRSAHDPATSPAQIGTSPRIVAPPLTGDAGVRIGAPVRLPSPAAAQRTLTLVTPPPRRVAATLPPLVSEPGGAALPAVPSVAMLTAADSTAPAHGLPTAATVAAPGEIAAAAYARLAAGDRRGAVRLFDAALLGDDPRAAQWRRERQALTREWSASAYSIVRASGAAELGVPLLGGGQSGAVIAFTPDPLSPRPFAVSLRGSAANDGGSGAFAAVGVEWRPLRGVTLAVDRRFALQPAGRDDWAARIAAGSDRRYGPVRLITYAEVGAVGRVGYAAAQSRIGHEVTVGRTSVMPAVGGWGGVQHDGGRTIGRLDVGPGITARAGHVAIEADYRFRVAGNAAPGSGPVLTLSAAF